MRERFRAGSCQTTMFNNSGTVLDGVFLGGGIETGTFNIASGITIMFAGAGGTGINPVSDGFPPF